MCWTFIAMLLTTSYKYMPPINHSYTSHLRNAVLSSSLVVLLLTKSSKHEKSTVCPRTNIMKYRLRGEYTVLSPLSHIVKTTTGYIASQETIHYEIPFLKICTLLFLDTIPKRMQLCVVALWRYY